MIPYLGGGGVVTSRGNILETSKSGRSLGGVISSRGFQSPQYDRKFIAKAKEIKGRMEELEDYITQSARNFTDELTQCVEELEST